MSKIGGSMGHTAGSDIYRKLGRKVDNLPIRAPWNRALHDILKSLYSQEEADVVVKMPYGASTLEHVAKVTKYEFNEAQSDSGSIVCKGACNGLVYKQRLPLHAIAHGYWNI